MGILYVDFANNMGYLGVQKHPAGSEMERGGDWILPFHSLCKPWYLQRFLMHELSQMLIIPIRFRISAFFPQGNENFIIWIH